ncbi:Membrane-bound lytic murein transglycosylase C precursor [compost metagenome]
MRLVLSLALGLILAVTSLPTLARAAAPENPNPTYQYIKSVAGEAKAKRYAWHIEKAAKKWKLDPLLVARVIRLESSFNPREVSHVGAHGLMQVMPFHFTRRGIPRSKWFDTATNLDLGCRILAWYLDRMEAQYPGLDPRALNHRALVAYNMGPRAVVSRGIYRSRYSEIIMKRYLLPGASESAMLAGPTPQDPSSNEGVPAMSDANQAAMQAELAVMDATSSLPTAPGLSR